MSMCKPVAKLMMPIPLIGVNLLLTYERYVLIVIHICKQPAIHRKNDLKYDINISKKEMIGILTCNISIFI